MNIFQNFKKIMYFGVAWYFRIFADLKFKRWNPRVILVTGSSGKTTLFHLIESQIGDIAKFSHHANSAIGIPFDILGIKRTDLTLNEWPGIFISAPFKAFSPIPKEKFYVVEADCDRPKEGHFLADFLKPEVTLWTNVGRTHSMNFDNLVSSGKFDSVEKAIAFEFGHYAAMTKKLVILNSDDPLETAESARIKSKKVGISTRKSLKKYTVDFNGTEFVFDGGSKYKFSYIFPKEIAASILMSEELCKYLGIAIDTKFSNLKMPPGRSSIFKGIKSITILDSAYNSNFDSVKAILEMFSNFKSKNKWAVLGDMLEQGLEEEEEHQKLAKLILKPDLKRIVLIGPRTQKYTLPILKEKLKDKIVVESFLSPKDVLDYLKNNIQGGELILFKGARFLEGVIENLLLDKEDVRKLDRREKIWEVRRKKWGL